MTVIKTTGRELHPADIKAIKDIISQHPEWSCSKISTHLVRQWNWVNAAGVLKDMSCRNMLNWLEKHGIIELPTRRQRVVNRGDRKLITVEHSTEPISCALHELGCLSLKLVPHGDLDEPLMRHLLEKYHYLSYSFTIGENLRYIVRDARNRVVAIAVWGSAALKVRSRDEWLGWDEKKRMSRLHLVVNNTRYLILPWVRVPHLASHLLGRMARRISSDWMMRYGHPVYLAETFVDQSRNPGTCYRAANWQPLGITTGRTRRDQYQTIKVPKKLLLVLPLITVKAMRRALECTP